MDYNLFLFILVVISSCCCVKCDNIINDFLSVPTTVKAQENNTVLLPCYLNTASNDGNFITAIRWYKDENLVVDSADEQLPLPEGHILWENGSLEIFRVTPNDTGIYICEIVRPEPWSPVRQRHAIEVLHPPSVEPFPPTGFLQVKLGEEVRMSCKGSGVPYPIITWYTKGEEIKLLNPRELLKFTASDRQMAGIYECRAANGVGEPASAQIELNIIYPPELMTSRSWIHTAPGHRVQLECKISADPQATVTWTKGDMPVPLDSRVLSLVDGDKYTLLIKNVQKSDFGIYTCKAINELGQGELQIQLSGVPNPGVFKKTDDKNINSKDSYTLIWEVDSYTPIIEYNLWFQPYKPKTGLSKPNWTKLTIPTEHSSGPVYSKSYTIKGLKEKTVYEALLVSRNRYGWSKPSPILRFATAGADLKEEMITPVQHHTEDNIIPLDLSSSSQNCKLGNVGFMVLVIVTMYYHFHC
ncbi:limbic system-associated membrane protein isoform X2 [Tribolium castaneum]|uniref:Protein turtle-like Protein n=1 Tax=Tribolium castaneum TaxID=7070 RepID=D6WF34_TRICA|nr:PREDICTED: limbic system-associated membrane protein [Tribolium castaneum]EFA00901.2 Protein turtle-like Protein [Tribolium castaneum]|eukprot:XP_966538.2 PREDICTED: limbic system-associated membrane protein [Tribolium castaneum]